jgi:hypothetical protein
MEGGWFQYPEIWFAKSFPNNFFQLAPNAHIIGIDLIYLK